MSFRIIRADITGVSADAIVNTANPEPVFANGTDRAVYEAAGAEELLEARKQIGPIAPGQAFPTEAFALPARYVIHTVGPAWVDGLHGEYEQLSSCYRESLGLAERLDCKSIAFPLISAGVYGFPKAEALKVALDTISEFQQLSDVEMEVILVVFNREAFEISSSLRENVDQFIDDHYVVEKRRSEHSDHALSRDSRAAGRQSEIPGESRREGSFEGYGAYPFEAAVEKRQKGKQISAYSGEMDYEEWDMMAEESCQAAEELTEWLDEEYQEYPPPVLHDTLSLPEMYEASYAAPSMAEKDVDKPNRLLEAFSRIREKFSLEKPSEEELADALRHPGESFQQMLLRLIDERNLTDPQVYKKANIDRKLFSKIRCTPDYRPRKKTVIALAIALELDLGETVELLGRAGMAFSPASRSDLIIEYCIENEIYSIYEINALLFEYEQPLLC